MDFLRRLLGGRSGQSQPAPASREHTAAERLERVRASHAATRHDFHRFAAGPYELDWDTQPDPFQRWIGAELVPLDHVVEDGPPFEDAWHEGSLAAAPLDARSIARFLEDSL